MILRKRFSESHFVRCSRFCFWIHICSAADSRPEVPKQIPRNSSFATIGSCNPLRKSMPREKQSPAPVLPPRMARRHRSDYCGRGVGEG